MAILSFCAALAVGQATTTQAFNRTDLGVLFEYPKAWKLTAKKTSFRFDVAVQGGTATIELFPANYKGDVATWQLLESTIANQKKQKLERQWQEELLGVPLLLTEIRYTVKEAPFAGLAGLLYSHSPRKMLFRIASPEPDFADVVRAWRAVLGTLRPVSGKIPEAEDPAKPWDPEEVAKSAGPATKVTRFDPPKAPTKDPVLAPVAVPAKVAGRDTVLRLPEGWSAKQIGDFDFELSHREFEGTPKVTVLSTLDSEAPDVALFKASSKSLDRFTSVTKREEPKTAENRPKAKLAQIWRFGKTGDADSWSLDASGHKGQFYWILVASGAGTLSPEDRKALASLLDAMSLEPAP